jgi:hypothetical protein
MEKKQNIKIKNKGTGAGGKNTTIKGNAFEKKTDNTNELLQNGYKTIILKKNNKNAYYLTKTFEINDKTIEINFVQQSGLKFYMKKYYDITMIRNPDEAYIIKIYDKNSKIPEKTIIKILEKKEQSVEGSVETKLWSSPSLKREYEILLGDTFIVEYGLCVNTFLKNKVCNSDNTKKVCEKYKILNQILNESNIDILYGDDDDYLSNLNTWINKLNI